MRVSAVLHPEFTMGFLKVPKVFKRKRKREEGEEVRTKVNVTLKNYFDEIR